MKKISKAQMGKTCLLLVLLSLALFTSGCAIGVTRVKLDHDPLARVENKREGTILVEQFKDVRPKAKEYIGNKRNMYGMVLGHIGTEEGVNLTEVLTRYFAEALREAGYTVVIGKASKAPEDQDKFDAMVEGEILTFWMDLYLAVWHKVGVKVMVKNPEGKILWETTVRGEETNALWIGATGEYEKVIRQAVTKALNKAASEFASEAFYRAIKSEKPWARKELQIEKEVPDVDWPYKKEPAPPQKEASKDRPPEKEKLASTSTFPKISQPAQWKVSEGGNGHYYAIVLFSNPITWTQAKVDAENRGGYLATILSAAENDFIFRNLVNDPIYWLTGNPPWQNQASGPWIGGFQPPGSPEPRGNWQWLNNDGYFKHSNWCPGEPNNYGTGEDVALFFDNNVNDPPLPTKCWNDWSQNNRTLSYVLEYNELPSPERTSSQETTKDRGTPDVDSPYPGKEQASAPPIEKAKPAITSRFADLTLPEYEIFPLPTNAPPEIRGLLGRWQGYWNNGVAIAMVFPKVYLEERKVECIHVWGHWGPNKDRKPGFGRLFANLTPGPKPQIKFRAGDGDFTFTLEGKLLYGTRKSKTGVIEITLEKVE